MEWAAGLAGLIAGRPPACQRALGKDTPGPVAEAVPRAATGLRPQRGDTVGFVAHDLVRKCACGEEVLAPRDNPKKVDGNPVVYTEKKKVPRPSNVHLACIAGSDTSVCATGKVGLVYHHLARRSPSAHRRRIRVLHINGYPEGACATFNHNAKSLKGKMDRLRKLP